MNIHFICRGNVLRSLMAETYLKSLNIKGVNVISSGTVARAKWNTPQARKNFAATLAALGDHGIRSFAKPRPDQLTQKRLDDNHDIVVCMNQRVIDEAKTIIQLPQNILNWDIADVGEGHRTNTNSRELYVEEIYQEITLKIDDLFKGSYPLAKRR